MMRPTFVPNTRLVNSFLGNLVETALDSKHGYGAILGGHQLLRI